MKIIFLCGCLEPGRDGVGDYTRMLATELVKQGHTIAGIALNDYYVSDLSAEQQHANGDYFSVFRIPSVWKKKKRFDCAGKFINDFDPDWLSLQFVIYGFHPKGVPIGLAKDLFSIGKERLWHIMFHELWVGFSKISSLKHKITGLFQSKIVNSIINTLQPALISTSNVLYKLILKGEKVQSSVLPLFSNIDIAKYDDDYILGLLNKWSLDKADRGKWTFIGIFGTIHHPEKLQDVIVEQLALAKLKKKKLAIVIFGRNNTSGVRELERLQDLFLNEVSFYFLGEQSSESVSNLLRFLDAGISCTPVQYVAKSGVFAAMKLHGLEVHLIKSEPIPEYDAEIKEYYNELLKRPPESWSVTRVSSGFINILNQVKMVSS